MKPGSVLHQEEPKPTTPASGLTMLLAKEDSLDSFTSDVKKKLSNLDNNGSSNGRPVNNKMVISNKPSFESVKWEQIRLIC